MHSHAHHHPHHSHSHKKDTSHLQSTITPAFWLNFLFVLVELAGGLFTGSIAILADAIHDLGDCLSLGLAWGLEKLAGKDRDKNFSYGYARFSLLSALITGFVIALGSSIVAIHSLGKLFERNYGEPHGLGMIAIAIFGLFCNGLAAYLLHRNSKSLNEKMLSWHFVEDTMGWLAVLVGAIFIYWKHWYWVDPLLALAISTFILWNVGKNLKQTAKLFLQSVPDNFPEEEFIHRIKEIPGVEAIHDLHIWSLDGSQHILSMHIKLETAAELNERSNVNRAAEKIKQEVRTIAQSFGNYHTTIEIEYDGEVCKDIC